MPPPGFEPLILSFQRKCFTPIATDTAAKVVKWTRMLSTSFSLLRWRNHCACFCPRSRRESVSHHLPRGRGQEVAWDQTSWLFRPCRRWQRSGDCWGQCRSRCAGWSSPPGEGSNKVCLKRLRKMRYYFFCNILSTFFSGNRGNPVYELKSTFCGALGLPFTDTYEKRQNKMSWLSFSWLTRSTPTWVPHVPDEDLPVLPPPCQEEHPIARELELGQASLLALKETQAVTPPILKVDPGRAGKGANCVHLIQDRVRLKCGENREYIFCKCWLCFFFYIYICVFFWAKWALINRFFMSLLCAK